MFALCWRKVVEAAAANEQTWLHLAAVPALLVCYHAWTGLC
jgi:hypothetical protein